MGLRTWSGWGSRAWHRWQIAIITIGKDISLVTQLTEQETGRYGPAVRPTACSKAMRLDLKWGVDALKCYKNLEMQYTRDIR